MRIFNGCQLIQWLLVCALSIHSLHVAARVHSLSVAAIIEGAEQQIGQTRFYDPAYVKLSYPNGDVDIERGVCSDVVVRALRHAGHDLQVLVHQDMKAHFSAYPKIWGLKKPDTNIDHRRVPNLEIYFKRQGKAQLITTDAVNYLPGDIVSWRLDNGLPHIGIVANKKSWRGTPMIIHNIGWGTQMEDGLFSWKIVGHYRY